MARYILSHICKAEWPEGPRIQSAQYETTCLHWHAESFENPLAVENAQWPELYRSVSISICVRLEDYCIKTIRLMPQLRHRCGIELVIMVLRMRAMQGATILANFIVRMIAIMHTCAHRPL
jgi:hypothetical protein